MNAKTFAAIVSANFACQFFGIMPTVTTMLWSIFLIGYGNKMITNPNENYIMVFRNRTVQSNAVFMVMSGLVTMLGLGFKMINLLGIGNAIMTMIEVVSFITFVSGYIGYVMASKRSA